jgi:hypothetical protein
MLRCSLKRHPGGESLLDQFGVIRCQAVLGLQDGDGAGLQVLLLQGLAWISCVLTVVDFPRQ